MPKTKISEFDVVAANNTDINGIDIAEGCAPSGINNAIRTLMSDLKDWQAGTSGDTLPIAAGGTGATTAALARTALGATTTGSDLFTSASAAAARTTLGATTTGSSLFTAVDAAAARTAIGAGTGDVTTTGSQVLTNKTISADNNTLSGIAASSFVLSNGSGNIDGSAAQKAIPAGVVVGTTDTQVLTNKTIDGASNTLTNLPLANITEPNLPTIRPSLNLDFANTKQLDPRITFTRASTGTFYNGITTAVAEQNLLLQSQTFDVSGNWGAERTAVTANSTAAPDGTTTADTLTNTATTGTHVIAQTITVTTGLSYTFSVFAKKNTNDFIQLTSFGAPASLGSGRANFNISTGVVGTVDAGTSTITDVGNGWYRCTYTVTATTGGALNLYVGLITTATAVRFESYTATGSESIFLWGAQLEQRSTATAYTATTTQPITNYIPVLQTAQNNVARFEHNPITGESLGLEIEEQRTNLLTYSSDYTNAIWTKSECTVTADTVVAPDGTLTADKLIANTNNLNHQLQIPVTLTSNTTYSISVFSKAGERTSIGIGVGGNAKPIRTVFNLNTLTFSGDVSTGGTIVSKSFQSVGNGWYRVVLVFTTDTSGTVPNVAIISDTEFVVAPGNGFSGSYIWGAQLEAGAFPTSYIPTVASQVTRSADVAVMTGTNFSSWFNNAEGTLYGEWQKNGTVSFQSVAIISDGGATSNLIGLTHSSGSPNNFRFDVNVSGVNQASLTLITGSAINTFYKTVGIYRVNDFAAVSNAGTVLTDTSGTIPVVNQMGIGNNTLGGGHLCGTIKKLAYYPARIPNAQLQALTTV